MAYTVISAGGLNFAVYSDTNPPSGPIFTSTPVETGNSGEYYSYIAAATDPNDQELTYSLVSPPDGMTINQWTGKISWVPDDDDIGANSITVRVTDEDSLTADQTFTLTIGVFTGTDIDAQWLLDEGSAPYYLDTASETYRLQVDVTTNGTAFAIIANNVTLNLNGHTVTYDNMTPIAVANHSFEDGTGGAADNWDFTNAPHGTRNEGVWLSNQCYDGDYAIKFTGWTGDEYIESSGTVTLPANTPIALTWMGYNKTGFGTGCYCYCHLISQDVGGTDRESNYTTESNRGIQLNVSAFITGETEETYKIRVGAVNPSGTAYTPYIDDIRIGRQQTAGVCLPAYYHASYFAVNDVTRFGNAYDPIITNGTIVQGQDAGHSGHGIAQLTARGTATIYDVDVTVAGHNSRCITGYSVYSSKWLVEQCQLTSNCTTISSRDNRYGYVLAGTVAYAINGIYNNTITNGPQGGIYASGTIAGNTIQLKGKYTNNFAIDAINGSQVHDNIILCGTGEYNARGIRVEENESATTTQVYDNTITVQSLKNNQESSGWQSNGAYGIQIENAVNADVYNNTVTAIADTAPAVALRMTSLNGVDNTGLSIHDNTFTATRTGSGTGIVASALSSTWVTSDADLSLEDNDFTTNSRYWFDDSGYYSNYTITRSTWKLTGDTTGFVAFGLTNCDMTCVDNAYYDEASETAWDEGTLGANATLDMQTT